MSQRICKQCFVSGRVQGVAFRYYTLKQAQRLSLQGEAINLPDGRVRVLVCGEATAVDKLCAWLHQGPSLANVTEVQCETVSRPDCCEDFKIG
jgi:acylphosphatase